MEEAPENGKESPRSARANEMNEYIKMIHKQYDNIMTGYHLTNLQEDSGPLEQNTASPGASQHFEERNAVTFKGSGVQKDSSPTGNEFTIVSEC